MKEKAKNLLNALTVLSVIETQYNEDDEILSSLTNYGVVIKLSLACNPKYSYIIKSIVKNLINENAKVEVRFNENTNKDYVEINWKD